MNPNSHLKLLIQEFGKKYLCPHISSFEKEGTFPKELFLELGKLHLLGIGLPEKWGGTELSWQEICVIFQEFSKFDPGFCLSYLTHTLLFLKNLYTNGNDYHAERYFPSCLEGHSIGAMAMSEPQAGSDALGLKTHAIKEKDKYIINGSKIFITNGPLADYFLVYARTGSGKHDISTFIVEKNYEGFSIGKPLLKMGMKSSPTCELFFHNCAVPLENLVGEENKALTGMMQNLDGERVALAAMSLGISQACLDYSFKYVCERQQFSIPLVAISSVTDKIANMAIGVETSQSLLNHAIDMLEQGGRQNSLCSIAKTYISETATQIALDSIQVLGGYGYLSEYPVEKLMRDAKLLEIGGGSSDVLRGIIVKELIRNQGVHLPDFSLPS